MKGKTEFTFQAIGVVRTSFKDKFGIPRQPGLASKLRGILKLHSDPDLKTALNRLETFSHLWVLFVFHEHGGRGWKPSIRPPRLGGAEKVGVLASRSPHRPNPIGMSVLKIESIDLEAKGGPEISVAGVDLLDGTPILDLKPYIPYADSLPHASAGWADEPIERVEVIWSEPALTEVKVADSDGDKELREMITEVLELDPRPAFQKKQIPVSEISSEGAQFGFDLFGYEIKYKIQNGKFVIQSVMLS
ncbi:MAG: tRNA (N6-threonylcarbamoyladenosine(37)-N6)-methyltransferase TrmO [Proteobacteria bacterium]|nr:tRNA (N6-threonylcarbamoyladenosine(37)-N6)-methyltransferase TrmO [Pseudomonadota bacterium]